MPPTYGNTSRLNLRKLLGSNLVRDVDAGFDSLAEDVDAALGFGIPQLLTALDMVPLIFVGTAPGSAILPTDHATGRQAAALVRLPRRIVGATRIRWKYIQDGSTAWTGNYALGLYNAAGTKIIDTGSVAATGATGSIQIRSETIAATTFEAGLYYLFFGGTVTAGVAYTNGVRLHENTGAQPVYPNVGVRATSGGATAPANLLSFGDVALLGTGTTQLVPQVALSVG